MKLSYLIFTVSIDLYIRGDNNQFSVFCGLFFLLSPALACHGYGYIRFKIYIDKEYYLHCVWIVGLCDHRR